MTGEVATDTPQVHLGFESNNPADVEKGKAKRTPRRIIYFQNGDQLEEYSTDEEEEVEPDKVDLAVESISKLDWKSMSWGTYIANLGLFGFLKTIKTFEYAGEVISYKLGITSPKYQSEIEEAERQEAEEAQEKQRAQENDVSWNPSVARGPELRTPSKEFSPPEVKAHFDGRRVDIRTH